MSPPPLPTTTLAIIINWVQRMGQVPRHGEKVLQIVWSMAGTFSQSLPTTDPPNARLMPEIVYGGDIQSIRIDH